MEQVLTADFVVEIKIVDPIWLIKQGPTSMRTCQRKAVNVKFQCHRRKIFAKTLTSWA